MNIHHIAIWVRDLERVRAFYLKYFDCTAGGRYANDKKGFASYFIRFGSGARIELMYRLDISTDGSRDAFGWTHLAIDVGSRDAVDRMTSRFAEDGFAVESRPRVTGDGYYESVILDPEGNRIELVAYPDSKSAIEQ